jgi:hypothetical protein
MVVLGVLGLTSSRTASLVLVLASVGWVYADVQPEGAVLIEISAHRGVVLADLYGIVGALVGVALFVRGPGRRRGR